MDGSSPRHTTEKNGSPVPIFRFLGDELGRLARDIAALEQTVGSVVPEDAESHDHIRRLQDIDRIRQTAECLERIFGHLVVQSSQEHILATSDLRRVITLGELRRRLASALGENGAKDGPQSSAPGALTLFKE